MIGFPATFSSYYWSRIYPTNLTIHPTPPSSGAEDVDGGTNDLGSSAVLPKLFLAKLVYNQVFIHS